MKDVDFEVCPDLQAREPAKAMWEKPEIVSFEPIGSTAGIYLQIGDGISNLTA